MQEMGLLHLTSDGQLGFRDYRALPRTILETLTDGPLTIYDLIMKIRREHIEYRNTEPKYIIQYIADFVKHKYIRVEVTEYVLVEI